MATARTRQKAFELRQAIERLVRQGVPTAAIRERLGCSRDLVYEIAQRIREEQHGSR